jgi:hypothetical protein
MNGPVVNRKWKASVMFLQLKLQCGFQAHALGIKIPEHVIPETLYSFCSTFIKAVC